MPGRTGILWYCLDRPLGWLIFLKQNSVRWPGCMFIIFNDFPLAFLGEIAIVLTFDFSIVSTKIFRYPKWRYWTLVRLFGGVGFPWFFPLHKPFSSYSFCVGEYLDFYVPEKFGDATRNDGLLGLMVKGKPRSPLVVFILHLGIYSKTHAQYFKTSSKDARTTHICYTFACNFLPKTARPAGFCEDHARLAQSNTSKLPLALILKKNIFTCANSNKIRNQTSSVTTFKDQFTSGVSAKNRLDAISK